MSDSESLIQSEHNVVILGATSAIAYEVAKRYADTKSNMVLVARNTEKLSAVAADLQARGATIQAELSYDLSEADSHQEVVEQVRSAFVKIDLVLVAYGSLGVQKAEEQDPARFRDEFNTNFTSVVSLLTYFANIFSFQKHGTIAVIASVAGDRGRQSNYYYGAAKGALSIVLSGLRNRLHSDGVNVLTVKPGFVATPMTADLKQNFLFAQPGEVADQIVRAIAKRKSVIYSPWYWRYIMLVIKLIPEAIFKRLSL